MYKKVCLLIACSLIAINSFASSPDAWIEFEIDVRQSCESAMRDNFESYTLVVDTHGSQSYGIAIAVGKAKRKRGISTQVCVYDKRSKEVEISSPL